MAKRRRKRVLGAAVLGVIVAAAVTAFFTVRSSGGSQPASVLAQIESDAAALPAPVRPAFTPPKPRLLTGRTFRWAPVRRAFWARARPAPDSARVARLETITSEGTRNLVRVIGSAEDVSGRVWVHVLLPILPNSTTGWLPRRALGGYNFVDRRLVVDLENYRAVLFQGTRRLFEAEIGVGKAESPTPKGEFYIRSKLTKFRSPFYGPVAFGTSARSAVLTDWPGGGYIGIHGTNEPELLPGRVSHGCIRMRNDDILRLARLLPVGAPLTIR
jgi:hypothetical protein